MYLTGCFSLVLLKAVSWDNITDCHIQAREAKPQKGIYTYQYNHSTTEFGLQSGFLRFQVVTLFPVISLINSILLNKHLMEIISHLWFRLFNKN